MMKMIDTTSHLYSPERAEALAATMQAQEDGEWTYRAVHDPNGTGLSSIAVYDEEGDFVSKV